VIYYKFCTYYVDNKHNLKNIMELVANATESKIKEELFLLLSFFILTYEYRIVSIQSLLFKNRDNFYSLIGEFKADVEEEETE